MIVKHLSARLDGIKKDLLNDEKSLSKILKYVSKKINMTILGEVSHEFNPEGVSVIILLKESHIAIHSWPESGLLDVEIVSCNENSDLFKGLKTIAKNLNAKNIEQNFWEYSF